MLPSGSVEIIAVFAILPGPSATLAGNIYFALKAAF